MPVQLKCEYAIDPVGIDVLRPRLFWQLNDPRRGARQSAYQIQAGAKPLAADLWDSGKVESDANTHVEYGGPALASSQRVYWQVRTWDQDGIASAYSAPAFFEMGLLHPTDWRAAWITLDQKKHIVAGPALYLRRAFELRGSVTSARLYITAQGIYVPYLNGQRIGADRYTPGWTEYKTRLAYQTYDVTAHLQSGSNALGVILGDGWHCGHMGGFKGVNCLYGDRPWLLSLLKITHSDGSTVIVSSDADWTASKDGPITGQSLLDGDTIDARKAWNFSAAEFSHRSFARVKTQPLTERPTLVAQEGPTVRKIEELPVREFWKLDTGDHVFDFGQNMVGVIRLKVRGRAGQTITATYGEILKSATDRSIYTANLRGAKCTDQFILAGSGTETFEPLLTNHGFRYVQLHGLESEPSADTVTGLVLHSDTPPTGTFACSHAKLNQLQRNIVWGQKGNFVEVPTDCPQRDERLGWMGDAQVFARTSTFNMDVAGFFTRWMRDVGIAQVSDGAYTDIAPDFFTGGKTGSNSGAPAWADAGVICPWTIYLAYGDQRILRDCYASMCRYIDYLDRRCDNGLHPGGGYGDWLAIGSETSKELIGTAYSAYSISLMHKIARILGRPADEARFGRLFDKFRLAFQRAFIAPAGRLTSASQTAAVLALRFGLLDEPMRARVADWLADDVSQRGVITTGFVGCNLILPTLTDIGREDLAWKLLTNEKFPSWLFSVNQGATTIWERWDGWTPDKGFQDPGMNSFNHYAYGSCGQWMYAHIGGIELDDQSPGFKRILINPTLTPELTHSTATLETLYGRVSVSWTLRDGRFALDTTIPANTTAQLGLPGKYVEGDVPPDMLAGAWAGRTYIKLPAGTYRAVSQV